MSVKRTIDKAIRIIDQSDREIADELFDILEMTRKKNLSKGDAQFISEKFFDGKVSDSKLLEIFRKYKNEYL